jgi:hypothetical protein
MDARQENACGEYSEGAKKGAAHTLPLPQHGVHPPIPQCFTGGRHFSVPAIRRHRLWPSANTPPRRTVPLVSPPDDDGICATIHPTDRRRGVQAQPLKPCTPGLVFEGDPDSRFRVGHAFGEDSANYRPRRWPARRRRDVSFGVNVRGGLCSFIEGGMGPKSRLTGCPTGRSAGLCLRPSVFDLSSFGLESRIRGVLGSSP